MNNSFFNTFLKQEPYYHLLFWGAVLSYPYLKFADSVYSESFLHELNALFFKVSMSYFLYLYVFPKQKKNTWYLFVGALVLILNTAIFQEVDSIFHPVDCCGSFLNQFTSNFLTFSGFGALFYGLFTFKNSLHNQLQIDELTNEKQKAELNSLRAQINPHFLFNTLNTIYARAEKTDKSTAELILKLSNGFRYFLHEGQQESVTLAKEISHLHDYIDLQQERLRNKVIASFSTNIADENHRITPLIFIPFVENAFKYTSVLKGRIHPITITLTEKNKKLQFVCTNPFSESLVSEKNEWLKSGIGISNTKRQLDLLYPSKYKLRIDKQNSVFMVMLTIQL